MNSEEYLEKLEGEVEKENNNVKKESKLKKLWEKTIFPDMIESRRKEKAWQLNIKKKAKEKARQMYEETAVDDMAKEELDKLKGKKKGKLTNVLNKIGKEFESFGTNTLSGSEDKINRMLGTNNERGANLDNSFNFNPEKILGSKKELNMEENKKMKHKKKKVVVKNHVESFEDKMKRMLS